MAQANMQPKRISEYTPTTTPDGNEILLFAKNGANGSILIKNLPISMTTQAALNLKTNDASLAAVAKSGSYADLTNKPVIPTVPVQSVAGRTGDVVVNKTDVGLSNVDNTSDANKPLSSATVAALAQKLTAITSVQSPTANFTASPNVKYTPDATSAAVNATLPATNAVGDLIFVGKLDSTVNLVNVVGKINGVAATTLPLRTNLQGKLFLGDGTGNWNVIAGDLNLAALDARFLAIGASIPESQVTNLIADLAAKAPLASPTFTGTPSAPTAAAGTNSTQIATTAFIQSAIASLIASAPTTLDTLNEIATALGNDPNFSNTIMTALGARVQIGGDITGTPTAPTVAFANDTLHVLRAGDTMTGPIAVTGSGLNETNIVAGTTKGIFTGVVSGDTARIIFTTGTANQAWEIDNNNSTFRWYQAGTTYFSLTSANATFNTNLIPASTGTRQIGTNALYWTGLYATNLYLTPTASFTASGSAITMTGRLKARITGTTLDAAAPIQIDRVTNSTDAQAIYFSNGVSVDYYIGRGAGSDDLVLGINGGGGFSERLRFTTAGDVYTTVSGKQLGNSTYYWGSLYATRHWLNSTAYIDGATAGLISVSASNFQVNSSTGARFGRTTNITDETMIVARTFGEGDPTTPGGTVAIFQNNSAAGYSGSVGFISGTTGSFNLNFGNSTNATAGQITFNSNVSSFSINQILYTRNLFPNTNATYNIGGASSYYSNSYVTRQYYNATAFIDGATAGSAALTGNFIVNTGTVNVRIDGVQYYLYATNAANTIAYGAVRYDGSTFGILGIGRDVSIATNNGNVIFKSGGGSETEYMRLTSTGLIGVLNTTPAYGYDQFGGGFIVRTLGTVTGGTGTPVGTAGTTTYQYYIVGVDRAGRRGGIAGPLTVTTGNATLSATNYNALTWTANPRFVSYEVLKTDTLTLLGTTTTASINDTGQATSTYTNRKYHDETGDVIVNGQLYVGTGTQLSAPKMHVQDADATIAIQNGNENGFGFTLQSYGTMQWGLWNTTAAAINALPANTKRSMFGIDSNARVGTLTNAITATSNGQSTTGSPTFRNLIDDGTGAMVIAPTSTGASSFQNGFTINQTVNQSGTAAYNGIYLNVTETAVGSGAKTLLDLRVGGASKLSIDNGGKITLNNGTNAWTIARDNVTTGDLVVSDTTNGERFRVTRAAVVNMPNVTTAPSTNATAGGYLYVEGGALKYRGSSGTVTVIGPA